MIPEEKANRKNYFTYPQFTLEHGKGWNHFVFQHSCLLTNTDTKVR